MDPLRNLLLAGLGAVTYSKEKLQTAIQGLVEKGELSREQGEKVLSEWVERGQEEQEKLGNRVSSQLQNLLSKLSLVNREEFDELRARVESLEEAS